MTGITVATPAKKEVDFLNAELLRREPTVVGWRHDGANLHLRFRAALMAPRVQVKVVKLLIGETPVAATIDPSMISASGLTVNEDNAVDGDTGTTAWNLNFAGPGDSVTVDFGANNEQPCTLFRLFNDTNVNAVIDVDYSDDGAAWTTVSDDFAVNIAGDWNETSWAFVGPHRYWRIVYQNTPGPGPRFVREIELHATQETVSDTEVDCRGDRVQDLTLADLPYSRYHVFLSPVQYDGAGTKIVYDGQGGRPDNRAFVDIGV